MIHRRPIRRRDLAAPAAALIALAVGAALRVVPSTAHLAVGAWWLGLAVTGTPVVWRTLRGAVAGRFAADLVATLAIVGALLLGEPVAGLVVVLMQTGGETLERLARGRASRALEALEAAAPRVAHRLRDGAIDDVPASAVRAGDTLLLRPGEMVPCDAVVTGGRSHVDTSMLTGEPQPLAADPDTKLLSGMLVLEGSLTARATAPAAESQYARIVELVRSAQASKAPLQRLADRYAAWFTPLTLLVCVAAYVASGDATRVLAVLVVATPCPLILAAPIALVGGIDRAARRQIIVRSGDALERLTDVEVVAIDKTGTLTVGHPEVAAVVPAEGFDAGAVLRLAASVEQGSGHPLARTVVRAAKPPLAPAFHVVEEAGRGVVGEVDGRRIVVGSRSFVAAREPEAAPGLEGLRGDDSSLHAFVAVNGRAAGRIEFADRIRAGARGTVTELRRLGVRQVVLLSGDHERHARAVGEAVGVDRVEAELLPADKVRAVEELVATRGRVMMVGDGTNDAPALARASVGVALAAHGGGVTAEAADVVVLADDLGRVPEAVRIARRALGIARQSIWIGLGLSAVAMGFAAAGAIAPVVGALLQEGIDVAVILNAIRGGRAPRSGSTSLLPTVRAEAARARDTGSPRTLLSSDSA